MPKEAETIITQFLNFTTINTFSLHDQFSFLGVTLYSLSGGTDAKVRFNKKIYIRICRTKAILN
jgi:hypothetical protein